MKYKCLVLDHDDTVVNSTTQIHYPAFLKALKKLRPEYSLTLEEYFIYNFTPGFVPFCVSELKMTEEELKTESEIWLDHVQHHIPTLFDGMKEIIERQKSDGGLVCVVSHSHKNNILRDYKENGLPTPDAVFGWEQPEHLRKPSPYPLNEIMRTFNLEAHELLMVDDLKPGYDMARSCNVPFAAASWAYDIDMIKEFMKANCDFYFDSTKKLYSFLFD